MELAVSVAPHAGGFRASTGGPLDLTADGPTADAAVGALRELVFDRVGTGVLRTIHVPEVERALEAAARVGENPQFDAFLEELAEHRRLHNTVPDDE